MEDDAASVGAFMDNVSLVAMSAAVHADMLQHRVEQLQLVRQQFVRDAAEAEELEAQLHDAIKSAERVAVMSKALADARTSSRVAGGHRGPAWVDKPEARAALSNTTPMQDILKFAKTAEAFDGESSATGSILTAVETTQAQVGRLQAALETKHRHSVREKLAKLESLKAACRQVSVHDALEDAFGKLRFPSAAEAYFFGPPDATGADVTAARRQRLSANDRVRIDTVVTPTNILRLLRQAARRLTLRFGDALDVLGSSMDHYKEMHPSSATPQDEERLLYASDFSQRLSRVDAESVRLASFLHNSALVESALADEYAHCCAQWVASVPAAPRGNEWHNTVLNPESHIVIPASWATARMLRTTEDVDDNRRPQLEDGVNDDDPATPHPITSKPPLLPPARHILTHRFSASDATELCVLQQLRMDVQRRIVDQVLVMPPAVRHAVPRLHQGWHGTPSEGDRRQRKIVWPVLASTRPAHTDA